MSLLPCSTINESLELELDESPAILNSSGGPGVARWPTPRFGGAGALVPGYLCTRSRHYICLGGFDRSAESIRAPRNKNNPRPRPRHPQHCHIALSGAIKHLLIRCRRVRRKNSLTRFRSLRRLSRSGFRGGRTPAEALLHVVISRTRVPGLFRLLSPFFAALTQATYAICNN